MSLDEIIYGPSQKEKVDIDKSKPVCGLFDEEIPNHSFLETTVNGDPILTCCDSRREDCPFYNGDTITIYTGDIKSQATICHYTK